MSQRYLEDVLQEIGPVETLKQGVALFVTQGMSARNLSARTRREYQNDLNDVVEFLGKRGVTRLDQVSLQHLESYQAEMDRRDYKPSTRQRKTYAIKTVFKF
jgi:site-specific recombinase XerD